MGQFLASVRNSPKLGSLIGYLIMRNKDNVLMYAKYLKYIIGLYLKCMFWDLYNNFLTFWEKNLSSTCQFSPLYIKYL